LLAFVRTVSTSWAPEMKYQIKATDAQGRDTQFLVDSPDEKTAVSIVRSRGFFPYRVANVPKRSQPVELVHVPEQEQHVPSGVAMVVIIAGSILSIFMAYSCSMTINNQGGSSVSASSNVRIGSTCRATGKCFGARLKGDLQRSMDMHAAGDSTAFMQMFATGRLVAIPEGTVVSVEDLTIMGEARVRIRGTTEPVWVISQWFN